MWSMLFQAFPGSVGAPRSAVYFFSERCSLKKKTELFFKKKGYKYLYGAVCSVPARIIQVLVHVR